MSVQIMQRQSKKNCKTQYFEKLKKNLRKTGLKIRNSGKSKNGFESTNTFDNEYDPIIIRNNFLKAIGPDCISHKMLKLTKFGISKPLCLLFNQSLEENTFPEFGKLAHVIPLFKKDDPSLASN